VRRQKPGFIRGLNLNHNHQLKNLFKSAATTASAIPGPFREFYEARLAQGMQPALARLTLARKIAAITLHMVELNETLRARIVRINDGFFPYIVPSKSATAILGMFRLSRFRSR